MENVVFSWQLLEEGMNPIKGPVSSEFGFMFNPWKMKQAKVLLPDNWLNFWKNLPHYFANKTVRQMFESELTPLDVDLIYQQADGDSFAFMKTKSIVFCIAQACVDVDREIAVEMPEPEPLPAFLQKIMDDFARYCECPDYCALADMSLTASIVQHDELDLLECTFDDFLLICPVNNTASNEEIAAGDQQSFMVRANAENRFHNTPTMMEFRVSDIAGVVAEIQKNVFDYQQIAKTEAQETAQQREIVDTLLALLAKVKHSFRRLHIGFALLSKKTVDPIVWHRDIVKYTSGYGGHLGLSGPQAPSIHLIDAFLGRKSFNTELGNTSLKAFQQIQHNHQQFIKAVAAGPSVHSLAQQLAEKDPEHPLVLAYNNIIDTYTKGFLSVHKSRAVEFAEMGFEKAGPREFTAETEYTWPATNNVVEKLQGFFEDAKRERSELKINLNSTKE